MKTLQSQFIVLQMDKARSEWGFSFSGLIRTRDPGQYLRIAAKKIILRNDFQTIVPGKNQIMINSVTYTLQTGSPDALLLASALSAFYPDLSVTFDAYDGTCLYKNGTNAAITVTPLGSIGHVIGLSGPVTIPGGASYRSDPIDLAPPETIIFRCQQLSSSLEIAQSDDKVRSTDLFVAVGLDVTPYGTKVYRDSEGLFSHILSFKSLDRLDLRLEDIHGNPLVSQNPITCVIVVELLSDDSGEHLSVSKEALDLARLRLLQADLAKPQPAPQPPA